MKRWPRAALYAGSAIALYRFGVLTAEQAAYQFHYTFIEKNLVKPHAALLDTSEFKLGIYRPELPFDFSRLYTIEESLGVAVSIISFYQAWGNGERHEFKKEVMHNLSRGGFTPMITWEPWVAAFPEYERQMPDSSLMLISQGTFDEYIRSWAEASVRYGKPFFLRPLHEASNPAYPWSPAYKNTPAMYKDAWKHIIAIFRNEGAENVAFVWTPYTPADTVFYPGDEWVDWIGLDIFNYGPLSAEGFWIDFFTLTRSFYNAVKHRGKPLMVAETGSVASGGNRNDWYRDMFHYLAVNNFPQIKALVIFDHPASSTPTGMTVDLSMTGDPEVYAKIRKEDLIDSLNIPPYPKEE